MIIKRKHNPLPESIRDSAMVKFFYFEAPGDIRASQGGRVDYSPTDDEDDSGENSQDESDVQVSTTTIRASRGGRTDYSPADDSDESEQTDDAQPENAPAPDDSDAQNQDGQDTPADSSDDSNQDEAGENDIEADDENQSEDVDYSSDVPDDGSSGEDGGDEQQTDAPTENDGSDDNDSGDSAETTDDSSQEDSTANDNESSDDNDVAANVRKYNLYRDYLALFNSVNSYIEKLESSRPDSIESNIVINSVLNKFHRIKDSLYEYMTIKYGDSSYLASLMFFQQAVSAVRLCFSLIRNNKAFINQEIHLDDLEKDTSKKDRK